MPKVYIGIGSNIDRENSIRGAVRELNKRYGPLKLSAVYESRPHGFDGENFFNLVAAFDSNESIEAIKQALAGIEDRFGRVREGKRFSARTLDLDLLLYGDTVRHDDKVNVPHPDIPRYAFVLGPLAQIAPHLRHPETGMTCAEMWSRSDKMWPDIWPAEFEWRAQG